MEKIANLKEIQLGGSLLFDYKGKKALLIRTQRDELAAYVAVCPHEGETIEWDEAIQMVLCECHLSLFNAKDGSVYRHSSLFKLDKGLTKIEISVLENHDIFAP